MIFSLRRNKVASAECVISKPDIDYQRLIDVSLLKLSSLQQMGKARTERQILLVMDVLQRSLFSKSLQDYKQLSIADLIFNFEMEIMKAMDRSGVDKLPRLWIDLPCKVSRQHMISTVSHNGRLPFRIKAAFSKRK